jgi:general secretion pathway protein H
VQPLISPTGASDDKQAEDGFTLLEMVCVITILALLAAVVVPTLPHGTTRARLESYAIATAALLKADHAAALRRQVQVHTDVDPTSRVVRSGATGQLVQIPGDVAFDALLPARCGNYRAGSSIQFFSTGMSCGGVIALSRSGVGGYEVRVNWLTGGIEVVPFDPT